MSKFSDFFRNASDEDKAKVYRQVIERAMQAQQETIEHAKRKQRESKT